MPVHPQSQASNEESVASGQGAAAQVTALASRGIALSASVQGAEGPDEDLPADDHEEEQSSDSSSSSGESEQWVAEVPYGSRRRLLKAMEALKAGDVFADE